MSVFFGNTAYSVDLFGYADGAFEIAPYSILDTNQLLYQIEAFPRNLLKARIIAVEMEAGDAEDPTILESIEFDLAFPNGILEGSQGILAIEQGVIKTRLKFISNPSITISAESNLGIAPSGTTFWNYSFIDGKFYIQSSYNPISKVLSTQVTLVVDNSVSPSPGIFSSLKTCVQWILENCSIVATDQLFSTDAPAASVIVEVHYGLGEYKEAFYLPNLQDIGVKFVGIPSPDGKLPVINATGIVNQFSRLINVNGSRRLFVEGIHFARHDKGSTLVLATRNSQIAFKDCTFENGDATDKKGFAQAVNSQISFVGKIKLISASGLEGTFFISDDGVITFSNVIATPTGNANGGLSVSANMVIEWETIFSCFNDGRVIISSHLDGVDNGTPRYDDRIRYQSLSVLNSGGRFTNESTSFPKVGWRDDL